MQKNEMIEKLDNAMSNFSGTMNLEISHSSIDSDTKILFDELARQTFYLFTEFEDVIKQIIETN